MDSQSDDKGRSIRLVQISDCHLPSSADKPYRGLRADDGLEAVLAALADHQPDALLLTGDLSEDASEASYQRLLALLAPLDVPIFALPGNHDWPGRMQRYFPMGPYSDVCIDPQSGTQRGTPPGAAVYRPGDWQLLLLDSSRPRRIDGRIDDWQLQLLERAMKPGVPAVLALHHQPLEIGSPWIDKYRLEQPQGLLDFVAAHAEIRAVVWGHVHQAFETKVGSTRYMSCPSTAANSLPGCERFTLDPAGPACRWLELRGDGGFETGILHAS